MQSEFVKRVREQYEKRKKEQEERLRKQVDKIVGSRKNFDRIWNSIPKNKQSRTVIEYNYDGS